MYDLRVFRSVLGSTKVVLWRKKNFPAIIGGNIKSYVTGSMMLMKIP